MLLFLLQVKSATEVLKEVILTEQKAISESSYTVSGILSSSDHSCTSRSENLKEVLEGDEKYIVYKFNQRQEPLFLDAVSKSLFKVCC